jgi:hypothetical protein
VQAPARPRQRRSARRARAGRAAGLDGQTRAPSKHARPRPAPAHALRPGAASRLIPA